jgi:hypothetical protein
LAVILEGEGYSSEQFSRIRKIQFALRQGSVSLGRVI